MRKGICAAAAASLLLSGCIAPLIGLAASGAAAGGSLLVGDKVSDNMSQKYVMDNAPHATAKALGQNIAPASVKVYQVQGKDRNATWMADTPLGRYSCSASSMMTDAYCVKQ